MICRRPQGFTLIELMAAMAIFSLLAVAMYGGTSWIILEREILLERQGQISDLQRTVRSIQDDLTQLRQIASLEVDNLLKEEGET